TSKSNTHHCIAARTAQNKHSKSSIFEQASVNITALAFAMPSSVPAESPSPSSTISMVNWPVGSAVKPVTPHKQSTSTTAQHCRQAAFKASWTASQDCAIAPKNVCSSD